MTDALPIHATPTTETPSRDLTRRAARVQAKNDMRAIRTALDALRVGLWLELHTPITVAKPTEHADVTPDGMADMLFQLGMHGVAAPQKAGNMLMMNTMQLGEIIQIPGNLARFVRRDYNGTQESALVIPLSEEKALHIPVTPANMRAVIGALNHAHTSLENHKQISSVNTVMKVQLQQQLLPVQIIEDIASSAAGCTLHYTKTGEVVPLSSSAPDAPAHGLDIPHYKGRGPQRLF